MRPKGVGVGFWYFYVHFVTEVICFTLLGRYACSGPEQWALYLFYDMLAFVPQGIVGAFSDRFSKVPVGVIGMSLMAAAVPLSVFVPSPYVSITVLCIGNACVHVDGAEVTLRCSRGTLSSRAGRSASLRGSFSRAGRYRSGRSSRSPRRRYLLCFFAGCTAARRKTGHPFPVRTSVT